MFEITGDDIAALNDEDLRTLVGRLCEAELRRRGISSAAATWGGNHTAKDGGLDVRVEVSADTAIDGFVPKRETGFQVKKPDMPRAEILNEMRPKPKRELRPVIAELANASGAYIIVSATGSTTDDALTNRRKAMADAVTGTPNADQLTLDFYDRNRIATWTRDHPGLIPWVRSRIGKSIPGWQSFGSWSYRPEGIDAAYLVDATARIKTDDRDELDGISVVDGINKIRSVLRAPGHVVRLTGLSGVGKTRFAEALFEPTIGLNALDPSLAVYTDAAHAPEPQPGLLASDLIVTRTRAILIIDNCPPAIHRQLAEIARQPGTTVSVVTIEYDIREDQPEGTEVFSLEPSSPELIEKLIEKRFPDLSPIDRKTISNSSGGNARVAFALAGTVGKNETVAGLSDSELFRRLFQQRNDPDTTLLSIAQACSLVYSFQGETLDGDDAELPILGGLVGKSAHDVFAAIAELKQRHLLQARGPWRAVLPHAIANRLGATALERIHKQKLLPAFENGPGRILRSFSRRLGYLDGSKEAREIVQAWLAPGGLLSDVVNLNELGRAMFSNVAPVMPGATLSALESALAGSDDATLGRCTHFLRLLRSLAYDPEHFERALALLVKFAKLPPDSRSESEAAKIVKSLFYVALSGTHAPLQMRLKVLGSLLQSADDAQQKLGIDALEAMLKTSHFVAVHNFEFGVRSRNYGYHPTTRKEKRDWFSEVLNSAEPFALLEGPVGQGVRHAIAQEFRGLWTNVTRADELERIAHSVAAKSFWREGWIMARQTRTYDGPNLPAEMSARLKALEEFLRPKNLLDKVRAVVLGARGGRYVDLDDLDEVDTGSIKGAMQRATATIEALGHDVAIDDEALRRLLPDLIAGDYKVVAFGRGIGLSAEDPHRLWRDMIKMLAATREANIRLMGGFLGGLQIRDATTVDAFLDSAVEDPTLAHWFPSLQTYVDIDDKGLARLHRSLAFGKAPSTEYHSLAYGRACDAIPGPEFKRLVLAIGAKIEGNPVARQILSMRIHSDEAEKRACLPEVAEIGRALLSAIEFQDNQGQQEDYDLGIIARASLAGHDGKPIVRKLCRALLAAAAGYTISISDYNDLVTGLLQVHPTDMLDELVSGDVKARRRNMALIAEFAGHHKRPMDVVPDDQIVAWCEIDPEVRYPFAAAIVPLFDQTADGPNGWKPIARVLLLNAPEKEAVFRELVGQSYETSGVGSISSKYESRLKLLLQLDVSDIPILAGALAKAQQDLQSDIDDWRRRETEEDRARSGTFE